MALSPSQVVEQTRLMLEWRQGDSTRLDRLYKYLRGRQSFLWLPDDIPDEVGRIAEMCRVNVLGLVVDSVAQSMYVDGYRAPKTQTEAPAWNIWQRNRMDARQIGVHRSALGYGASYVTVLPGDPVPVIRGISPRYLTTVYGEDEDWPMWALEKRRNEESSDSALFRLFDEEMMYWVRVSVTRTPPNYSVLDSIDANGDVEFISAEEHGRGVVPVVRFLAKCDLDDEVTSEIEDLIPLQDQINLITFALHVVQHYGAFPQKWIVGWSVQDEADPDEAQLDVAVNKILTFSDPETKLGQFDAADLGGYIDSRQDALRNLASISQTPAHALRGELVNLSAEALAAAEQSERRKITEREMMFGEAWEQVLELAGGIDGVEVDPEAQVRWKDTEARAFAATVDALGKLAQMLQVPVEELWERIPGVTQQDVQRWKATARLNGDVFSQMTRQLERQATANTGL